MTDRELLDRVRAVRVEVHQLMVAADANSKHFTKSRLERAWPDLIRAEDELAWHVEGPGDRP